MGSSPCGTILRCGTLFLVDLASRKDEFFCLHFADVNELEIVANETILSRIEDMVGSSTLSDLEKYLHMLLTQLSKAGSFYDSKIAATLWKSMGSIFRSDSS
jgi:hypothetical protein